MCREKFITTVKKFDLINENDSILVALSGGADSVSLLMLLLMIKDEYKLHIEAAHVNHMIRKEAENDEKFCRMLCEKNGVPFHFKRVDIPAISKEKNLSEENAGRIARYSFFESITAGRDFKIATAHNKDDSAENFLINAIRGTAPKGIPPKRDNIIRPLIEITKKEIYEFLKSINQDFCEDKTNFLTDYTRNKVRIELIPYINEKFDTNFTKVVYNNLDVNYFEDDFLNIETKKFISENVFYEDGCAKILLEKFEPLHLALKRRVIREIYYSFKNDRYISFEHTEKIIYMAKNALTGKKTELCGDIEAEISYKYLIFRRKKEAAEEFFYNLKIGEEIYVKELNKKIYLNTENKGTPIYTDAKEFILRTRKDGDRVYIKNVGHKKLKSLLIDKKIERQKRNSLIILEDKSGICYVEDVYVKKEKCTDKIYLYIEK